MIDINELRRLAQAATPGPWKIYDDGSHTQHVGDVSKTDAGWQYDTICNMYEDVSDNYDTNNDYKLFENSNNNAAFIAAANPTAVKELLDRLEASEKSDAESIAMYRKARDERNELLEALREIMPFTATSAIGCHGDKCREPWCYSCNSEEGAEEAAQKGRDAWVKARAAIACATGEQS